MSPLSLVRLLRLSLISLTLSEGLASPAVAAPRTISLCLFPLRLRYSCPHCLSFSLWCSRFAVQIILGTLGPACGSYSGLLPLVGGLVSVISCMLSGENVSDFFLFFIMNTVPSSSNLFMWSLGSSACSSQNYWFSSSATVVQESSLASNSVLSSIAWVSVAYLALFCDPIAFSKSIYPPFF